MKHISKTKTIIAVILAALMAFAVFGTAVAFAEGEDESSEAAGDNSAEESTPTEDTSSEDTQSGDESSEDTPSGDESSEDESSEDPVDPDAYRISFTVNKPGSALCYFDGSDTPATEYVGTKDTLSVKVVAAEHYELDSVVCVVPFTVTDKSESSFELHPGAKDNLTISAATTRKQEPVSLTVSAFGADAVTVEYDGETHTYADTLSVMAGTQVTVSFDIGDTEFEKEKASLSANGVPLDLESASYTFTIEVNTSLIFSYDMVHVTFNLHGPVTVNAAGYKSMKNGGVGNSTDGLDCRTGSELKFTVSPSLNYKLDSVTADGEKITAAGGTYSIVANGNITVDITVSSAGTTPPAKDEFSIRVNVGSGGKLSVGTQTIAGGNGTLIKAADGDELSFTVTPDAGYRVDSFRVGGEKRTLTNNKYTFKVEADTQVQVTFTPEDDAPVGDAISVKSIDWDEDQIIVDVTAKSTVLREVFEKMASEPKGKAVEFRGVNGSVIVPTGVPFDGSAASANLEITRVNSGEAYNTVGGLLGLDKPDAIPFAMFSFNFGLELPEGTTVFLKTGAKLAGEYAQLKLFDSANVELYDKEGAETHYKAASDGTVGPLPYGNEGTYVLVKETGEVPEITHEAGEGGEIIASPYNNVQKIGDDYTFYVNAKEGYTISSLRVDGVEIGEAAGKKTFQYSFKVTAQNHRVNAQFASAKEEETSSGSSKTGPILAIILVALAGAAALFIVKWRQEKY
ncbi:MAG: hypothetical protein IKX92_04480 [Clostridia bacterium]|nr:hypothetical protein [Clostridia bacterium]